MATRLTATEVIFPDGSRQGERAERILLARIPITTSGAAYALFEYDAGINISAWNCQIDTPMLAHGINAWGGGWTYYNSAFNANNVRFGMQSGSGQWGHWERTRWNGPHIFLFNFRWRTSGIAALNITHDIHLYYMTNVGV